MTQHKTNLVGLGPPSCTGDAVTKQYMDQILVYRWNPRIQRLCWFIARLGIYSAREQLPVGLDPDGRIGMSILPAYEVE